MSNCYVVDEQGLLLGVFTLRELVMAPDHKRLDQFMAVPRAILSPDDDQEQAVALMERVDCVELPVVDDAGQLVGTVTADDALEVLREEATEDMERMAAILPSEQPYLQTRIWDCLLYTSAPRGRTRFQKVHEFDAESRHLVLLCRNEEGYRNPSR